MQGIKLLFDQDSINQLKRQYDEVIKELENKKVHVDFSDANRSINELTNKVRELQGINLKSNTLDTNIKEETRNLDELIKKYTELGYKVNIKNQQFKLINPEDIENSKRELNNFVIELEKTKGIIDKITYTAQHNEKGLFTGFTADNNVIRTDNSVKIAEQLAKEEEKLANAIGKVREQSELKAKAEQKTLELNQAQAQNKALEQEYEDREKIQQSIRKTIKAREQEQRELEKNQAQAQNKVLEQEYLMKQKHQKWLQTLGADVTPEGFKFDVKKSTYADMERLAKDFGDVNAEIKKIDVQPIEKSGDVVRNVTYRVRDSKDKWHEYKLAVVEAGEDGTASLRKLDQGTRDVINRQVSLGSRLKNAWIAVTSFASVTTVFYAAVHEVQKAVSMMNDLDKSMTNIQMITGETRNEVQGLVGDYNDLATELHTTTKEMMSGAEEFLRAGKSVEETQNLLKASTIGAAISGQTNSETSEQLIAISNGFKLNTNDAKELTGVIDKLSAVDNSSSTSFKELATAMQYTSSSAQNAGVSMEDLISYIGTVSSVSRRSAESIGTSFRNIFSRYSAVSAGKDIDDEGEKINDVEKALNNLGIAIRSDATHFKDFSTVIGELNKKWSTLNDLQKNQAVGALAGTKNRENLLILMDNMDQVKKLQDAMANSTNSAEKKFEEAYGESTQAKVADFKHQVELFWQGVMNNKAINFFIDLGTQIIKVFKTINEQSVGTKIALVATSFALIEVIRNIKSVTKAISDSKVAISGLDRVLKLLFGTTASGAGIVKALKTAFSGLKTAIVALFTTSLGATIIALTSAITLCTIAITKHIKHQKELREETEKNTTAFKDLTSAIKENNVEQMKSSKNDIEKEQQKLQDLIKKRKELIDSNAPERNAVLAGKGLDGFKGVNDSKISKIDKEISELTDTLKNAGFTIDGVTGNIEELNEAELLIKNNEIADEIKNQAEAEVTNKDNIINLTNEYLKLNEAENKNAIQKQRMTQISNELNNQVKGLILTKDAEGNVTIQNVGYLQNEVNALNLDKDTVQTLTNVKLTNAKATAEVMVNGQKLTYETIKQKIKSYEAEAKALDALAVKKQHIIMLDNDGVTASAHLHQEINKFQKALDMLDKIYSIPKIPKVSTIPSGNGGFIPKSDDNNKKSKSKSTSSNPEDIVPLIDRYSKLNGELEKVNAQLELNKSLQSKAENQDKITLLNKEIDLLKQKQVAIKAIWNEEIKEQTELKKTLSSKGVLFDSKGEITNYESFIKGKANTANKLIGDNKKKAIDDVKKLEDEVKRYGELTHKELINSSKDWEDAGITISDVGREIEEVTKKIQEDLLNGFYKQLESTIYGGKSQREYERNIKEQNKALQTQIDILEKEDDLQQEQEERSKRILEIHELEAELENIKKEKNIQQLTQKANGSYDFTYVADENKIDDITKDLKSKHEDYYRWEKSTAKQHQIQSLRDQIEYNNNLIQINRDAFEQMKEDLKSAFNGEDGYISIVNNCMDDIKSNCDSKWSEIIASTRSSLMQLQSLYQKMLSTAAAANSISIGSSGGGGSSSHYGRQTWAMSDDATAYDANGNYIKRFYENEPVTSLKIENGKAEFDINGVKAYVNVDDLKPRDANTRISPRRYGEGGDTGTWLGDEPKWALLDKNEFVLNDSMYKNMADFATDPMKYLSITLPKMNIPVINPKNNNNQPLQNVFHIDKLDFPNVHDGQDVVDTLNNLPRIVMRAGN